MSYARAVIAIGLVSTPQVGADAGVRAAAEAALLALTEQPSLGGLCRGICAAAFPGALLGALEDELEHAQGLPTPQVLF